jgi:hypothetical protein
MKTYTCFFQRSDWIGNLQAILVTMVTWGFPSHPDNRKQINGT